MIRELGIFERAQLISNHYATFHIVGVLRINSSLPSQALQRSLTELQKRHPFLSAHIADENGRPSFTSLSDPKLPLRILPRLDDDYWIQVTESELENRIDAQAGPLFRCVYLHDESHQHGEIILTLSHSIADAASAGQLLHELMTICASLSDDASVSLPKLSPAPPLESRFPHGFSGWRLNVRILAYAFTQMVDEISYRIRTIGKRTPPFHGKSARGHILPVQFPSDLVEPFAQRARKEGVTLNSALNAALLLAVNHHLYNGEKLPMRTFSFADLRPHVEPPLPPENLGLYISMMRYTVDVDGDGDFWSLARRLHKKTYASLKSGDKFIASAMSESLMTMLVKMDSVRLCASALNYNGVVPVQPSYGQLKVLEIHGFVSPHPFGPEMASQAQLFNDQLVWDFAYLEEDMDQEKAKAIVDEIKKIILSVIAN